MDPPSPGREWLTRSRKRDAARRLGMCLFLGCAVAVIVISQRNNGSASSRRSGIELLSDGETAAQEQANEKLASEVCERIVPFAFVDLFSIGVSKLPPSLSLLMTV
jgi:hypothetical protein